MKKSTSYILPRPVIRKRRPWRFLGLLVCVAVAVSFFLINDDGLKLSFLTSQDLQEDQYLEEIPFYRIPLTVAEAGYDFGDALEEPALQAIPAPFEPAITPVRPSSRELAALAARAEEEPERPGMFLAAIGEGFSRLQSLPFFLPSPDDEDLLSHGDDTSPSESELGEAGRNAGSMFSEILTELSSGPVVYTENERYTVETDNQGNQIFRSVVAKGDTAGVILNEWLPSADVNDLINSTSSVYSLKNIVVGKPFTVTLNSDKEFVSFCYEPDSFQRIVIERKDGTFTSYKDKIEFDVQLVRVEGSITSSLFEAVADTGEGPVLAVNMAEVFGCEVNFINEIRKGDSFEVIVEKLYREGEFKGYGKMLAGHFVNNGKTYQAYMFPDAQGRPRYYNENGEALQKLLLKAPLSFTRVSSGYSMNRKHPVFGYSRPHQGVDYAAPTGTPIMAVGDGVLTRVGWGNGYGNMIVIQHSNGLQSQYAHMSGFAKGMKKGVRVRQGQTIGYVGATGVATGPHLDFRLIQNGKFLDPTKAISPRLDPVSPKQMAEFKKAVETSLAYLKQESSLAEYTPVTWGN